MDAPRSIPVSAPTLFAEEAETSRAASHAHCANCGRSTMLQRYDGKSRSRPEYFALCVSFAARENEHECDTVFLGYAAD